jgi:hypothetical protein
VELVYFRDLLSQNYNIGLFQYQERFVGDFYLRDLGYEVELNVEGDSLYNTELLDLGQGFDIRNFEEHQLIGPINWADRFHGSFLNGEGEVIRIPTKLEEFCRAGFIRDISRRINGYLRRVEEQDYDTLFAAVESPENEEVRFREIILSDRLTVEAEIQLEPPYAPEFINKLRNFVKFLEALVIYTVEVLSTKGLLVEELNFIQHNIPYSSQTWYNLFNSHRVTETYIQDLTTNYRFAVFVRTYYELFRQQLKFLFKRQLDWERAIRQVSENNSRRGQGDIGRIILSYLTDQPFGFIRERFNFEPPFTASVEGELNRVGQEGEDIRSGRWSVSTLRGCLAAYGDPGSPPYRPDYLVCNHRGEYQHLVKNCIKDIEHRIHCLSFEPIIDDSTGFEIDRSVWTDYNIYSRWLHEDWREHGLPLRATPYSWFANQLTAILLDEPLVIE